MMNLFKIYNLIFIFLFFALLVALNLKMNQIKAKRQKITSWKFQSNIAAINGTNISITLPFGTDATNLEATVKISAKASINPDPSTARDYTNPVKFTVTAEDGKTIKTYTVTVKLEQNTDAEIISWKFLGKAAAIKGSGISITLPFGKNVKNLKAEVKISAGATISPYPRNPQDYTNPVNFIVTSKDGKN